MAALTGLYCEQTTNDTCIAQPKYDTAGNPSVDGMYGYVYQRELVEYSKQEQECRDVWPEFISRALTEQLDSVYICTFYIFGDLFC